MLGLQGYEARVSVKESLELSRWEDKFWRGHLNWAKSDGESQQNDINAGLGSDLQYSIDPKGAHHIVQDYFSLHDLY